MQYFIATEDSRDYKWQVALLLESLRLLNLEDQVVVAVCQGPTNTKGLNYPNMVRFDNPGRKLDYLPYNKSYGLLKALEAGVLRQPFVVLDTDMFLLRDIPPVSTAAAQQQSRFQWERVKPILGDLVSGSDWTPVGGVYQFSGASGKMFEDVFKYTHDMLFRFGRHPDLHAWAFIIAAAKNGITFERKSNYVMPLKKTQTPEIDWTSHVVHYAEGCPPHFTKEKAFESVDFYSPIPVPFKKVFETPAINQTNVGLMQTLMRSWLTRNMNRVDELMS